ncbi:hypothetical protein ZWY2020_006094 [Hordeum vulgare]|nr:hypothetical protein ZWY2020_006094 [Hordeum vulgare]
MFASTHGRSLPQYALCLAPTLHHATFRECLFHRINVTHALHLPKLKYLEIIAVSILNEDLELPLHGCTKLEYLRLQNLASSAPRLAPLPCSPPHPATPRAPRASRLVLLPTEPRLLPLPDASPGSPPPCSPAAAVLLRRIPQPHLAPPAVLLRDNPGATQQKTRKGRGIGSGKGKTAGAA